MKLFGRDDEFERHKRRRPSAIYIVFRMALSLTMMVILALGVYLAFKHFSGVDPIQSSPKAIILSLISSEKAASIITSLLDAQPPKNLSDLKGVVEGTKNNLTQSTKSSEKPTGNLVLKFALVADSHNDNQNLKKGLKQAKDLGAKFVIGLGDYTQVGTVDELNDAKSILSTSGLPYYTIPGDHDLWASRESNQPSVDNFVAVFGDPYRAFTDSNIRFILIFNSDNYLGVDSAQDIWISDEMDKVGPKGYLDTFVFVHEPLYHPSSDHFMGKTKPEIAKQAESLISKMSSSKVAEVFAGDTHFFTRYTEPKTNLKMTTLGAITSDRNAQKSRFAIVDVYDSGQYNVEDLEVE